MAAGTAAGADINGLSVQQSPPVEAPASAPNGAPALPADLRGLADAAAAATLGAKGSHVLLLSVTTVGGFCVIALLLAAVVFCFLQRRRKRREAYVIESKPSQASMGSSGRGDASKPSPLQTTPKGLRQAYAKAAGRYSGKAIIMLMAHDSFICSMRDRLYSALLRTIKLLRANFVKVCFGVQSVLRPRLMFTRCSIG